MNLNDLKCKYFTFCQAPDGSPEAPADGSPDLWLAGREFHVEFRKAALTEKCRSQGKHGQRQRDATAVTEFRAACLRSEKERLSMLWKLFFPSSIAFHCPSCHGNPSRPSKQVIEGQQRWHPLGGGRALSPADWASW